MASIEGAKRPGVDWEAVEREYRGGILSLREIAELHPGTNHVAITRKAKKEGWERNLAEKIKAKAEALVTKQSVTAGVTERGRVTEQQVIETNAQAIVNVRLSHRAGLCEGREIIRSMMAELFAQCGEENADLLRQLGDMMRSPDEFGNDKLNDLYMKIVSLPGRAKTMKDLADSMVKLIDKERQAFDIDKEATNPDVGATNLNDAQRASRIAFLLSKAQAQ